MEIGIEHYKTSIKFLKNMLPNNVSVNQVKKENQHNLATFINNANIALDYYEKELDISSIKDQLDNANNREDYKAVEDKIISLLDQHTIPYYRDLYTNIQDIIEVINNHVQGKNSKPHLKDKIQLAKKPLERAIKEFTKKNLERDKPLIEAINNFNLSLDEIIQKIDKNEDVTTLEQNKAVEAKRKFSEVEKDIYGKALDFGKLLDASKLFYNEVNYQDTKSGFWGFDEIVPFVEPFLDGNVSISGRIEVGEKALQAIVDMKSNHEPKTLVYDAFDSLMMYYKLEELGITFENIDYDNLRTIVSELEELHTKFNSKELKEKVQTAISNKTAVDDTYFANNFRKSEFDNILNNIKKLDVTTISNLNNFLDFMDYIIYTNRENLDLDNIEKMKSSFTSKILTDTIYIINDLVNNSMLMKSRLAENFNKLLLFLLSYVESDLKEFNKLKNSLRIADLAEDPNQIGTIIDAKTSNIVALYRGRITANKLWASPKNPEKKKGKSAI